MNNSIKIEFCGGPLDGHQDRFESDCCPHVIKIEYSPIPFVSREVTYTHLGEENNVHYYTYKVSE